MPRPIWLACVLAVATSALAPADDKGCEQVEKKAEPSQPGASVEKKLFLTNSIGMKMRLIPAGSFDMGSSDEVKDALKSEKPQHKVKITRPFYLGVCEVTQAEYKEVMKKNPSHFTDSDRLPVEQVSWLMAVEFCNALSEKEGLKPFYKIDGEQVAVPDWNGTGYRLPTEAEWEYAYRAGSQTRYWFGDDTDGLPSHAWFADNSKNSTHAVGSANNKNAVDLHDMAGNVWEWCWDWYDDEYYKLLDATLDPRGPENGFYRVFRGGCWYHPANFARAAHRNGTPQTSSSYLIGLRLARGPFE